MRVLWFASTPCSAAKICGTSTISGGWLASLEYMLKKQDGIDLHVAFLASDNGAPDSFHYEGVDYHAIRPFKSPSYAKFRIARRFMSQIAINQVIARRIEEIINAVNPDIIHIHGTENPLGIAAVQAKGKDIPVVFSIQGLAGAIVGKFYAGLPENMVRKHESMLAKLMKRSASQAYKNFKSRASMEEDFLKNASYVIGRTDWDFRVSGLFNPARKYFHVDEIMRNPFYQQKWASSLHQPNESNVEKFRIVSIFSYGIYKGFETLLQTAAILKTHYCKDFEWIVIGYSANDECVKLAEKVTNINSSDVNLCFTGKQTADKMVDIMLKSNIFCNFSHIENSPNAVCEAMLLGMPVVATFAGGTSSIVKDGEDGLLVQEGEPYSAAGAIVQLLENPELAIQLGHHARHTALTRHDPEKICNDVMKVYHFVINNRKPSGLDTE